MLVACYPCARRSNRILQGLCGKSTTCRGLFFLEKLSFLWSRLCVSSSGPIGPRLRSADIFCIVLMACSISFFRLRKLLAWLINLRTSSSSLSCRACLISKSRRQMSPRFLLLPAMRLGRSDAARTLRSVVGCSIWSRPASPLGGDSMYSHSFSTPTKAWHENALKQKSWVP